MSAVLRRSAVEPPLKAEAFEIFAPPFSRCKTDLISAMIEITDEKSWIYWLNSTINWSSLRIGIWELLRGETFRSTGDVVFLTIALSLLSSCLAVSIIKTRSFIHFRLCEPSYPDFCCIFGDFNRSWICDFKKAISFSLLSTKASLVERSFLSLSNACCVEFIISFTLDVDFWIGTSKLFEGAWF